MTTMRSTFRRFWFGPMTTCTTQCHRILEATSRHKEIRTYCNYARRPLTSIVEILWSVAYTLPPYWPEALFLVAVLVWKWKISLWLFLAAVTLGTFVSVVAVQWLTELTTSTPKVPPCTYSVIYLQCGEAWAYSFGWISVLTHLCKLVLTTKLLSIFLDALMEHRVSSFAGHNSTSWATNGSSDHYLVLPIQFDLISPAVLVIICGSVLLIDYEERKILTAFSTVCNFLAMICMLTLFMTSPETEGASKPTSVVGPSNKYTPLNRRPLLFVEHSDGGYASAFSKILKLTSIFASLIMVPLVPTRPGHFGKFMPRAALLVAFLNMALVHTQIIAAGFTGYMAHFQGNNMSGIEFYFLGSPSDDSIVRRVLFFITCGTACLGIIFSAPLLQTPIIHTTVTMAKDGLLPAPLARDSRVPLVAIEYCLCFILAMGFDIEAVASIASVGALCQMLAVAYCCLEIRLGSMPKLISCAEYEQNSRALRFQQANESNNSAKFSKLKRYQETIKTLKKGMETLPQTVMAAASRSFSSDRTDGAEERRHFARQESVLSVSAVVDSDDPVMNGEKFRKASQLELEQLELAVREYERQKQLNKASGPKHRRHLDHYERRMNGTQTGLSYSCSVTILAAGSFIFALLLNLGIKLETSGLVIIDLLFAVFILVPNLCGMARLKRNPLLCSDSYRVPSLGLTATVTMMVVKTLAMRGCMDHYVVLSGWVLFGVVAYLGYGSRHSVAGLKRQKLEHVINQQLIHNNHDQQQIINEPTISITVSVPNLVHAEEEAECSTKDQRRKSSVDSGQEQQEVAQIPTMDVSNSETGVEPHAASSSEVENKSSLGSVNTGIQQPNDDEIAVIGTSTVVATSSAVL